MTSFAALFHSLPPEGQKQLLDGPASQAPPGVEQNLTSPHNRNALSFGVTTTGIVISSLVVIMWSLSKALCLKKFHLGDAFIVVGFGTYAGYSYCVYYWIDFIGMYVHTWDVTLRDSIHFAYIVYVGVNLYGSTIWCLKIGLLLEWARIFVPKGTRDKFWWTCNITLLVNVLFYATAKLVDNLACSPHRKIWDVTVEGHCLDQRTSTFASAIVNLASDLVILALPHSVIWKLNLPRSKKLGIACVFAVGVFCCVAAVFRVITCYQYYNSTDPIYALAPVALWDVVEMTLVIIIACLPSIPALFRGPLSRAFWSKAKTWPRTTRETNTTRSWTHKTRKTAVESSGVNAYQQIEEHSLSPLSKNATKHDEGVGERKGDSSH
ncbi:hypothetical protein GGR56DRAFT_465819 [Xylariaceae sp. FL0804]|nr:hypothetical protein GGR56DRAFT_465819 [Xylariaceae sp. FL0804]